VPRTGRVKKRLVAPDAIYNNRLVTKFINCVMKEGKKSIAQSLVYKAFDQIKEKTGQEPVKFLETVLITVSPRIEVRPRRIGGAVYQVPVEVKGERKTAVAIRLVLTYARKRSSKEFHTFDQKLVAEMIDISKGLGEAIKKRDQIHRMAEANKAFAHLRW
jgi:small subunit ribosomal protein S7